MSPPWEVLGLISYHLDPKTLAISSCVSKSWFSCFSSNNLWGPLCSTHFPSLSALHAAAAVPPRRLYGVGYAAARLRGRLPRKPSLSLDRLMFGIVIRGGGRGGHVMSVVRPCMELKRDPHGTFRFEVDVEDDVEWGVDEVEGVRVTWNVVDSEWKAVFAMAEESGAKKGGFASSVDGWFTEELPTPWCCSGAMSSGLVADLRLEMEHTSDSINAEAGTGNDKCFRIGGSNTNNTNNNNRKMKIKKVKVGVMCIINWRYLSVDDVLSYLDHFLHV
ncbi:hypothetical protein RND81_14G039800 [Saponaria officinalis]|uniref:F-box protein n=1 Tax=Saponaria officinalis TaxID=3572 RepID=A0AAW1GHD8_SAPOF